MDKATAIEAVRKYAQDAHSSYLAFADGLRQKLERNPNHVDAVMDFEKFIELRSIAHCYSGKLSLDPEGVTTLDDDKVLERIEDERKRLTDWLLRNLSQQTGLYGVHQHISQEAAKRFLTETQIINLIENEEN
jgi:hypothetical protein